MTLDTDDIDKSFGLGFAIEADNNHGVNHILEHTVMMGSVKFPSRNTFTNLISSSLSTFLNAMTTGKFTVYPFSSKIEKDYYNLMAVYMDLLFAPKVLL